MIPYGIVYKDTPVALREGATLWEKKSGIISKTKTVFAAILISFFIIAVNTAILFYGGEAEVYFFNTVILTVFEIVATTVLLASTVKKQAKNTFIQVNTSLMKKQAILRENDIEFSTPYSRSNYYYDEIETAVEGIHCINIVIDKNSLPVCISKLGVEKGETETFKNLLKEKLGERFQSILKGESVI